MIEKKVNIQDNFLTPGLFVPLQDTIMGEYFPWYFNTEIVTAGLDDSYTSPGQLVHSLYNDNKPSSSYYMNGIFISVIEQFKASIWLRIKLNSQFRLSKPYISTFHNDMIDVTKNISANFITSILYINTNDGYTEFEDGTIVESVENRLVTFPEIMKHRGSSQTNEQRRILMNFNYLKGC